MTGPTADGPVLVERPADGIAVVVLNRPERMNAMKPSTIPPLAEALSAIAADTSVRAVVLTGAGRGFCAGMDLSALDEFPPADVPGATAWMRELFRGSMALSRLPQPTIAAVNGPAYGGGFGLALACDIRIAGPAARFAATFVRMAMGPDAGLSHTLPRIVGHARALELLLTADPVDADEALRLGVVSRIVEDPLTTSLALAKQIAAVPGDASRSIKDSLRRGAAADVQTAIHDIEAPAQAELVCHPDFYSNAAAWLGRHAEATR